MLEEVSISGLGVIDSASVEFADGLTVLTGETGAGKTMVVTSLRMLSGARVDAGRVRTGESKAVVEGRFRIAADDSDDEVGAILDGCGAAVDDDDSVIAVRTVNAEGRSRAHLGGRSVPVGTLSQFTGSVLAIHGQNDQLKLAKADKQRDALDRFGGEAIARPLAAYQSARAKWVDLVQTLTDRTANARERAQEADRLRFGLEEIDELAPQAGEDKELAASIRQLSDLETIRAAADSARGYLIGEADGGSAGVLGGLGAARTTLESSNDSSLTAMLSQIEEALALVGSVGSELSDFLGGLPADAQQLESMLQRQSELKGLVRKYAPDVDGVLAWAADARSRLVLIDDSAESLEELTERVDQAHAEVVKAAQRLTKARVKTAKALSVKVSEELAGLAMGDASMVVSVEPDHATGDDRLAVTVGDDQVHAGPHGTDRVSFLLSAHSDATPLPIATSASGGELSRLMLALEVVLVGESTSGTMVFDEVDAGVGGRAAVEIGKRLAHLARSQQVIVVTHLPQVAAFADHHVLIGKSATKSSVASTVTRVADDERVAELARMLAGMGDSDSGRAHAQELLAMATDFKESPSRV